MRLKHMIHVYTPLIIQFNKHSSTLIVLFEQIRGKLKPDIHFQTIVGKKSFVILPMQYIIFKVYAIRYIILVQIIVPSMTQCSIKGKEEEQVGCPHCKKIYSEHNPPRLLPLCKHIFCQNCIKVLISKKRNNLYCVVCPIDNTPHELDSNCPSYFQRSTTVEEQAKKARRTSILPSTNQFMQEDEVCPHHHKALDIVCMMDRMQICAECALFGYHKGHRFETLTDFQKIKHTHCRSILHLMEQKAFIEGKIINTQIKQDILHLLQDKKKEIIQEAQANFNLLIKEVESAAKEFNQILNLVIKESKVKLQRLCIINPKITTRYNEWEKRALEQVKIIEGKKFIQCVELLNNKHRMNVLLSNGERIISRLKRQQESMMSKVETILNELKVHSDNRVREHIKSYLSLQASKQPVHEECSSSDEYQEPQEKENSQPPPKVRPSVNQSFSKTMHPSVRASTRDSKIRPRMLSSLNRSILLTKKEFADTAIKPKADKRKFPNVKDPQRYERNIVGLEKDTLQIVDFNNSQLGDNVMLGVIDVIRKASCPKCIRLVKNKLSDRISKELISLLRQVSTLVLCQNMLSDEFVDQLIKTAHAQPFPHTKYLYLGGNLMNQRRTKDKMEELKAYNIIVTL